jgi:hypothetical protein
MRFAARILARMGARVLALLKFQKFLYAATHDAGTRVPLTIGRIGAQLVMQAKLYCDRGFDRRNNTQTSGSIAIESFDVPTAHRSHANFYAPTPLPVFRRLMTNIPGPLDDFVFIDVGAGKGRVVMAACEYGFKEVVGVEFVEELCRVASINLATFRNANPSAAATVVCSDIADYVFPPHDSVIYLYNPFSETMVDLLVCRLRESLAVTPRRLFVIYFNDVTGGLERAEFLRLRRKGKLLFDMTTGRRKPFKIYETV